MRGVGLGVVDSGVQVHLVWDTMRHVDGGDVYGHGECGGEEHHRH